MDGQELIVVEYLDHVGKVFVFFASLDVLEDIAIKLLEVDAGCLPGSSENFFNR